MFSSWWGGENPAGEGGAKDSGDGADPVSEAAAAAKESGKAALDGLWNVMTKVATTVTENVQVPGILTDFSAEEAKFKRSKRQRHTDAAVPPWVGYNEEEVMRTQILALSADKRNFLRNPPPGVQFHFDFAVSFPVATSILEEDPMLERMRFELVPKQVTEEVFWRNYFYRVSLIKQSSQLNSLTAEHQQETLEEARGSGAALLCGSAGLLSDEQSRSGNASGDASPAAVSSARSSSADLAASAAAAAAAEPHEEEEAEETAAEFISDDFVADGEGDVQEWEKELHQELKDLGMDELDDVDAGADVKDDAEWEREIQEMLDMDESETS